MDTERARSFPHYFILDAAASLGAGGAGMVLDFRIVSSQLGLVGAGLAVQPVEPARSRTARSEDDMVSGSSAIQPF